MRAEFSELSSFLRADFLREEGAPEDLEHLGSGIHAHDQVIRHGPKQAMREATNTADAAKTAGTLTEDLNADLHDELQEHLKKREDEVDEILKNKTTEIMED